MITYTYTCIGMSCDPQFEKALVVHLRSGDIFRKDRPNPNYGQPPLFFYYKVLTWIEGCSYVTIHLKVFVYIVVYKIFQSHVQKNILYACMYGNSDAIQYAYIG